MGREETTLGALADVSGSVARGLAAAGSDARDIADVLGLDVRNLRTWRRFARER